MRILFSIALGLLFLGDGSRAWATFSVVPARSFSQEPAPPATPTAPMVMPVARPALSVVQDPVEADVNHLMAERDKVAAQMNQLNARNPASSDFALFQELLKNEKFMAALKTLSELAANPHVQKLLQFTGKAEVQEAVDKIRKHPLLKTLLWAQLGWMIITWFLGTWWRALGQGILREMGIRLVMTVVFFLGSGGMIPVLVLGGPYFDLIRLGFQNLL